MFARRAQSKLFTLFLTFKLISAAIAYPENQSAVDQSSHDPEPHDQQAYSHPVDGAHEEGGNHTSNGHHGSIHVASWRYDYVSAPFLFTTFVVSIAILKIIYHHIKPLATSFPESCLLIILGVLFGLLFLVEHADKTLNFLKYNDKTFFLFLLPPIILEAAYSLRDRAFVENIGTILLYAVVGTILNIAIVGPLIYGVYAIGGMERWVSIGFLECLIFSSLIAAVDPVAVLAIFQEVGVNKMLYFMVFGESLFNDAVTVVIYNMFVAFTKVESVGAKEVFLGIAAFLCVSFGAMAIGIVFGLLTGFITKYTSRIRLVEPVIFFAFAYLSYLCAEMVHFSGIISIICCGLLQAYYAMENISSKSYVSIVYFSKVMSSVMESLIFIILGVMMVNETNVWTFWSTAFTFWSLIFCLLVRFAVVFAITFLINTFLRGIRTVSYQEQFIMAYGGLRGAISFSLVFMLDPQDAPAKNTLLTATYFIILFTVFLQGISIKPLVKIMRVKLDVQDSNCYKEINRAMIENTLAGVEEIVGHRGTHYWTAMSKYISQHFVRPAIQKVPHKKSCNLLQIYQEVAIQQHLNRSDSTADVPKHAALWSQLEYMDNAAMSGSVSEVILQAQDDYSLEVSRKESAMRKESKVARLRPPPLKLEKLDSPKELLAFRDLLQSPAIKTMHYVYDKDLQSTSQQLFADSLAHVAMVSWKNKVALKKRNQLKRGGGGSANHLRMNRLSATHLPKKGSNSNFARIEESSKEESETLLSDSAQKPKEVTFDQGQPKFSLGSD